MVEMRLWASGKNRALVRWATYQNRHGRARFEHRDLTLRQYLGKSCFDMVGRMHLRIGLVLFAISCQCNFGMLRMIPKPKTTGTRRQRNRIESSRQSHEERSMKGPYLLMVSRTKRRYTDYKVLQPMMTHLIRFLALSNTYEVLRSRTMFWTLCS